MTYLIALLSNPSIPPTVFVEEKSKDFKNLLFRPPRFSWEISYLQNLVLKYNIRNNFYFLVHVSVFRASVKGLCLAPFTFMISAQRAGILKQSMGAGKRVGIGLLYRPARLHEYIYWQNWFLGIDSWSPSKFKFGLRCSGFHSIPTHVGTVLLENLPWTLGWMCKLIRMQKDDNEYFYLIEYQHFPDISQHESFVFFFTIMFSIFFTASDFRHRQLISPEAGVLKTWA